MVDARTLAVYGERAEDYARMVDSDRPDPDLAAFVAALPKGARVLDLGCGPARASSVMRAAGLVPDPVDASPEMVDLANRLFDIGARVASFDDIDAQEIYDGVYANFSLLHAPRSDLPRHLSAIARALKPLGHFHIGMKIGEGEDRDALGRAYTYYTVPELRGLLEDAGLLCTSEKLGQDKGLAGTTDPFVILRARKL